MLTSCFAVFAAVNLRMTEPTPNNTPPQPPQPQTISYAGAPPSQWVVIGVFPVGKWHDANSLLRRHGIVGQMRSPPDMDDCELLVLSTEAEWARELLRRQPDPRVPHTGGFAAVATPSPPAAPPTGQALPLPPPYTGPVVRAAPLEETGLSERQKTNYTIAIVLLWVLLGMLLVMLIITCL